VGKTKWSVRFFVYDSWPLRSLTLILVVLLTSTHSLIVLVMVIRGSNQFP
jgi:uncharacterized membrane protein